MAYVLGGPNRRFEVPGEPGCVLIYRPPTTDDHIRFLTAASATLSTDDAESGIEKVVRDRMVATVLPLIVDCQGYDGYVPDENGDIEIEGEHYSQVALTPKVENWREQLEIGAGHHLIMLADNVFTGSRLPARMRNLPVADKERLETEHATALADDQKKKRG